MRTHKRGESTDHGGYFARCECVDGEPDAPAYGQPGHWYVARTSDGTPTGFGPDGDEYERFDSLREALARCDELAEADTAERAAG